MGINRYLIGQPTVGELGLRQVDPVQERKFGAKIARRKAVLSPVALTLRLQPQRLMISTVAIGCKPGLGTATFPIPSYCLDHNFGHQIDTGLPPAKAVARAIYAVSLAWTAMARIFAGFSSKLPAAMYSDARALRAAQLRETSQV